MNSHTMLFSDGLGAGAIRKEADYGGCRSWQRVVRDDVTVALVRNPETAYLHAFEKLNTVVVDARGLGDALDV